MPKKTKPTKAPAAPRRKWGKLRDLFSKPGVALTIDEIATALGNQKHSARAAISVLGNPAHSDDPLRITLDRETKKYSVAPTHVAGADAVTAPAKKPAKKRAAKGRANGPRVAAA